MLPVDPLPSQRFVVVPDDPNRFLTPDDAWRLLKPGGAHGPKKLASGQSTCVFVPVGSDYGSLQADDLETHRTQNQLCQAMTWSKNNVREGCRADAGLGRIARMQTQNLGLVSFAPSWEQTI